MANSNGNGAPVVYTELIDAAVVAETQDAYKLIFGKVDRWVPKAHSKIIDGRPYVARWLARKEQAMWNGQFIKGSQMTRMEPYQHPAKEIIDELVTTLRQFVDKLESLT